MISLVYKNTSVQLRSPDLHDTQDHVLGVQRRFSMDGKPHTWIPPIHDSRVLILTVRGLPREKILEFRDFLIATSGQSITYIDSDGISWIGVITSDAPTSTAEGADCMDTVTFQFEGKRA